MTDKPTTTETEPDERTDKQLLLEIYGRVCRLEGYLDAYLNLMEWRLGTTTATAATPEAGQNRRECHDTECGHVDRTVIHVDH